MTRRPQPAIPGWTSKYQLTEPACAIIHIYVQFDLLNDAMTGGTPKGMLRAFGDRRASRSISRTALTLSEWGKLVCPYRCPKQILLYSQVRTAPIESAPQRRKRLLLGAVSSGVGESMSAECTSVSSLLMREGFERRRRIRWRESAVSRSGDTRHILNFQFWQLKRPQPPREPPVTRLLLIFQKPSKRHKASWAPTHPGFHRNLRIFCLLDFGRGRLPPKQNRNIPN
jgi:hypothetical protein